MERGGYAIKTPYFVIEEGDCRQRPPFILWFGVSCASIVVLITSLIKVFPVAFILSTKRIATPVVKLREFYSACQAPVQ